MRALTARFSQQSPIALDVTLYCEPGQLLALVGPSGSGKTTVLRTLAGLNQADQGRIECQGHTWFDSESQVQLMPQQRRVGMVFQHYALFPHMTVAENLSLVTELTGRQTKSDIAGLLNKVHLSGLEHRYPSELSGGQQQRVALARALARKPAVLLLDEPFSAVDKVTRRKLYLELHALRRELEMPIVLVTHDLDEAAMLADQLCVIHQGKTLQQGVPEKVLYKPDTVATARQVDIRNLFEGELKTKNGQLKLHWHRYVLDVGPEVTIPNGRVFWTIPPSKVLLHQRLRPSRGEHENPIHGEIIDMLSLRGISTVIIKVSDTAGTLLQMDIPDHAVDRNNLVIGEKLSFSLVADAIHCMPHQA